MRGSVSAILVILAGLCSGLGGHLFEDTSASIGDVCWLMEHGAYG